MKYLFAPLFALSVISCSAPASIDGQIAGVDFSVAGAAATLDGDALTVLIRNAPLSCADAAAALEAGEELETPSPVGLQSLSVGLVTSALRTVLEDGTVVLNPQPTPEELVNGEIVPIALDVTRPFEIGVNAGSLNTATVAFSPDGCGNDGEAAIGGSVTIDAIAADTVSGSFDLVFVDGEASGTFGVDRCDLTPFTPDTALCQ